MLILDVVASPRKIHVHLSSIVALEENNEGKTAFVYLRGGHKIEVSSSVGSIRVAMKLAADSPTQDFEVSKVSGR